jgi:hypothetical protein
VDINDVILSMGGVERITGPMGIDASDLEISSHLATNCQGANVPTLAQVKAAKLTYAATIAKATGNAVIAEQIAALESTATNRRIREAVRGSGRAWLDALDDQIAALRALIVP